MQNLPHGFLIPGQWGVGRMPSKWCLLAKDGGSFSGCVWNGRSRQVFCFRGHSFATSYMRIVTLCCFFDIVGLPVGNVPTGWFRKCKKKWTIVQNLCKDQTSISLWRSLDSWCFCSGKFGTKSSWTLIRWWSNWHSIPSIVLLYIYTVYTISRILYIYFFFRSHII